jgi:hypothetical protein
VPRRCAVCAHPNRVEIEKEASEATSLEERLEVAARHKASRQVIERHLAKCLGLEAASHNGVAGEARGRETPVDPLPPLRELRGPLEELRHQAQLLTRQLERPDLTPTQLAQVSNALRALHRQMTAVREQAPIHDHEAFDGLAEDMVAAVVEELGPDAPDGIEWRIAERFEELQARRAEAGSQKRRAA